MKKFMKNKNKGFTIVELIVVMAIIAILILIAVPAYTKYIKDANETSEMGTAHTIYESTMAATVEASVSATPTKLVDFKTNITDGVSGDEKLTLFMYNTDLPDFTMDKPSDSSWGVYVKGTQDTTDHTVTVDDTSDIFVMAPLTDGARNVYENGVLSVTVGADGKPKS